MKEKSQFIVLYKYKSEKKDRFKIFNNLEDAFMFYNFKKDFCIKIRISYYIVLL